MYEIETKEVSTKRFEFLEPVDILYEFDGPRIFTVTDNEGGLNLAYWSDEDEHVTRYMIVPTSRKILDSLRQGALSVHDALNQPRCWLCDVARDGKLVRCSVADFEAIPRDALR